MRQHASAVAGAGIGANASAMAIAKNLRGDGFEGGDPLASPACHFVAPGHPGYAPECRYTRNPRRGIWSSPDIERALAPGPVDLGELDDDPIATDADAVSVEE